MESGHKSINVLYKTSETSRRSPNSGSVHDYKSVPKIISIEIGYLDVAFAASRGQGTVLRP